MSHLKRFFVGDNPEINPTLSGEEFKHAINVLRIKEGDEILVCDNSGYEYVCKVIKISKNELSFSVISKDVCSTETKNNVTLVCGYLKGDKTELVVQKAVELGVKEIITFSSKFSSSYINENKLARLNKVSVEAAKQCGRAIAPKVTYADTLEKALNACAHVKNKLFACEFATKNEVDFGSLSGDTTIVIGSEGGFSIEENDLALSLGFKTVFLGKRILRAETACISLTAIVMHSLKELE